MGRGASCFRCVDDTLVIMPEKINVDNKLHMLNGVDNHIHFTVEEGVDKKLPFLNMPIHHRGSEGNFSVYRKPTNSDGCILCMSNPDPRTKSGVLVGFFLRACRMCSKEFLSNECSHIVKAFRCLGYPMDMLQRLKKKAEIIWRRNNLATEEEMEYVLVPYSKKAEPITTVLTKIRVNIVPEKGRDAVSSTSGKKWNNDDNTMHKIPWLSCAKNYYSETS